MISEPILMSKTSESGLNAKIRIFVKKVKHTIPNRETRVQTESMFSAQNPGRSRSNHPSQLAKNEKNNDLTKFGRFSIKKQKFEWKYDCFFSKIAIPEFDQIKTSETKFVADSQGFTYVTMPKMKKIMIGHEFRSIWCIRPKSTQGVL